MVIICRHVPVLGSRFARYNVFIFSCLRQWFIDELTGSPINIVLLLIISFLIYKLLKPETGIKFMILQFEVVKGTI